MDARFDPGGLVQHDGAPSVVIRGYLITSAPEAAIQVLESGGSDLDVPDYIAAANDTGFGGLPKSYVNWVSESAATLYRISTDVFLTLVWRHNVWYSPARLHRDPAFLNYCLLDGLDPSVALDELPWRQVPAGIGILRRPRPDPLPLSRQVGVDVAALYNEGVRIPLGHELLRAAWRVKDMEPRAAHVMAVAAVETGLKEFVVQVTPDAAWWAREIASPPIYRIIKELLPTLPSCLEPGAKVPPVPQSWRRTIHKGVELRNDIVHGKAHDVSRESVEALLQIALEFLYFLDAHSGHEWAAGPAF